MPSAHPIANVIETTRRQARAAKEWRRRSEDAALMLDDNEPCPDCAYFEARGDACEACGGSKLFKDAILRTDTVSKLADEARRFTDDAVHGLSSLVARIALEERSNRPLPPRVKRLAEAIRNGSLGALLCLVKDVEEEIAALTAKPDEDDTTITAQAAE